MHCPDMMTRINYLPHFSASRDVPKVVLRRLTDEEVAGAVNGKRLGGGGAFDVEPAPETRASAPPASDEHGTEAFHYLMIIVIAPR